MKSKIFSLIAIVLAFTSMSYAGMSFGIVDFATCIQNSKYGKREQESFEALKKQMHSILNDTEKQLNEVVSKLQDEDYLDGLSPEGEKELRERFQALNEELNRYQSQYYQIMQQANMRVVQMIAAQINRAAQDYGKKEHISMILNKEAAFYFEPKHDVTTQVISVMDKNYEIAEKEGKLPDNQMLMADPKQMLNQMGAPSNG